MKKKVKSAEYTIPTIQSSVLRDNLGTFINQAYYQNVQYKVARNKKVMARIVPEKAMQTLEKFIMSDPALADTLALLLNEEAMADIEQGMKEYKEGKTIPLEEVLL